MSGGTLSLEQSFEQALRQHLERPSEEALQAAYELGRTALERGLGVHDTVGALMRALAAVSADAGAPIVPARTEALVLEALSPFEMAHRGARDANDALRRLDEVREEELRRVSRELHDSASQVFASVHLALSDLERRVEPGTREEFERIRALLVRAEEQLRRLAHEFRPTILDDLGLQPALAQLAESAAARGGITVRVPSAPLPKLSPQAEIALYRAVQEGLHNVVRHARARLAVVSIARAGATLLCRIEDDGRGFDPAVRTRRAGMGLRGMRERVSALGGTLHVHSSPGAGTRLELELPMGDLDAGARPDRR